MSLLLETLTEFGLCSENLCAIAQGVCCGVLHPGCAVAKVGLTALQREEVERIILMDPEQVELCALELGVTLAQLDQIKMRLWALTG